MSWDVKKGFRAVGVKRDSVTEMKGTGDVAGQVMLLLFPGIKSPRAAGFSEVEFLRAASSFSSPLQEKGFVLRHG